MSSKPRRLFVDISSHGFGHLAQVAPVLNELAKLLPSLRLTVRSGLPPEKLRARITGDFVLLAGRSDFGYVMLDALRIDAAASAAAYRAQHADWAQAAADEGRLLRSLQPDLVLTDVAYLPLAAAACLSIPSFSMCSLNWAGIFAHYFSGEAWAGKIHAEMLVAYRSAECFLRLTPGMAMPELSRVHAISPVAALGQDCRAALRARLACSPAEKLVLIAFGGIDQQLPVERWPHHPQLRWLIPASWKLARPDITAFDPLALPFADLLRGVDAVLTKPGYGTFTEAACNGTPVLYVRRSDGWPEQDDLIDWLKRNARCSEIDADALLSARLPEALADLWRQSAPPLPHPAGAAAAAALLAERLTCRN